MSDSVPLSVAVDPFVHLCLRLSPRQHSACHFRPLFVTPFLWILTVGNKRHYVVVYVCGDVVILGPQF